MWAGGNGATVWDCALSLSKYLEKISGEENARTSSFCGASVVELGAGTGLPGLVLTALGAHVLFTDRQWALKLLHFNLHANFDLHRIEHETIDTQMNESRERRARNVTI